MSEIKLTTSDEGVHSETQHTSPCHDCPWSRKAIKGWLGGSSAEEWLDTAKSEELVSCHVITNRQCAGIAIYRANTCKRVRDSEVLSLPQNPQTVFKSPAEFMSHHRLDVVHEG